MSRELKFRAWDTEDNKFFEPTFRVYQGELEDLTITFEGELIRRTLSGSEHESTFKGRYILQQFTGLRDKNGKEVYEGDIVDTEEGKLEVGWYQDDLCYYFYNEYESYNPLDIREFEIIGNIYENKNSIHET